METQELAFLSIYNRFVRYWWLLAAAAILGGGLGWLFSRIQPPLYDARASLEVSVDFSQTGNISPFNLDHAVNTIQGVFYSSEVLSEVSRLTEERFPTVDVTEIRKNIAMERYGETWWLRVRDPDPQVAWFLVNTWRDISFEALGEAREHAITARYLDRYLINLEICQNPPNLNPPVPPVCDSNFMVDNTAVQEIQTRLKNELADSRTIQPYLIFSLNSPADVPTQPVMYQTKWLVIGGMLSMFLITILLAQFLPVRTQVEPK